MKLHATFDRDILSAPLAIRTVILSATGSSKERPVFRGAVRVASLLEGRVGEADVSGRVVVVSL